MVGRLREAGAVFVGAKAVDLERFILETQTQEAAKSAPVQEDSDEDEKGPPLAPVKVVVHAKPIVIERAHSIPLFKALHITEKGVGSIHEQDSAYHLTGFFAGVQMLGEATLDPIHHDFIIGRVCESAQLFLEQAISDKTEIHDRTQLHHHLRPLINLLGRGYEEARENSFVRFLGNGFVPRYPALYRDQYPNHPAVCELERRKIDRELLPLLIQEPFKLASNLLQCKVTLLDIPLLQQNEGKAWAAYFADEKQDIERAIGAAENGSYEEAALSHILLHLERIEHSFALLKEHPKQLYLSFHIHNIYTSVTMVLEQLGYLQTIRKGVPLKMHDLQKYFPEKREEPLLRRANLGKSSSYPHYNNQSEGSFDLLETFTISINALLVEEGFLPAAFKKKTLPQLYAFYESRSVELMKFVRLMIAANGV